MTFVPYAVSWNVTSRCNLNCQHCYIDAHGRMTGDDGELSTQRALEIIGEIASLNPGAVLILTGGEPLARPDIYELIKKASELGMMPVLGSNGTMISRRTALKLKKNGLNGIGVSIDSLEQQTHDNFRGRPGALAEAMAGLAAARDAGIPIQVQTTPTTVNLDEIPSIAKWAHELGAKVFNIFFLVCTGRGERMADITPEEYEKILKWAADNRDAYPGMMIRPKCAPHFKRILHQENPESDLLKTYIAACRAGTQYCRIDPRGKVTPCPYMENTVGDLTISSFQDIWNNSPQLSRYRQPEYEGKCGDCRYRLLCGGCRARAMATTGNDMGEDQWCVYEPEGKEVAIENIDTQSKFGAGEDSGVEWTAEALAKLENVPFFARSIVKLGVEKYAAANGVEIITPETMSAAAPSPQARFGMMTPRERTEAAPAEPAPTKPAANGSGSKSTKSAETILWDEDARARVENAPDFVRPGILKLMQRRARARGMEKITTEFLTEIRDESMMLVTRRMKDMGFDGLDMSAWDKAKDKFSRDGHKINVIDTIKSFLDERPGKNSAIMEKFGSFFADNVGEAMGWTEGARARLEKAPSFARGFAKKQVEKYARENGYKYVTEQALAEAMEKSPFGKMGG
ncbi:MAG: radical SAM protein [Nitrospinota bacterium]|nr:radical SAM protein [Nitrospinota bacterium]